MDLSRFLGERSETQDRALIVRITAATFLLTLAISWNAYIHTMRIFALSPVIGVLRETPVWAEWGLLGIHAALLVWLLVKPLYKPAAFGVLACTAFWILQDLLRFHGYIYMYFFTIFLAVFFGGRGLAALRIMIASVYFWAGFHKLNLTFYTSIFPWFIGAFYKFPEKMDLFSTMMLMLVLSVPFFEAIIGIMLLFVPRARKLASIMAFVMLVVVLICLGPAGNNWAIIVWPWNVYLFLVEVILFYKPAPATERKFRLDAPAAITIALFSVAPMFAIWGLWHSYPSFKLFSGNTKEAEIVFPDDENIDRLPEGLGKLVLPGRRLTLIDWTAHESNVIVYPETYVFETGAKGLCPYLSDPQHAILRIKDAPPFNSIDRTKIEEPLCGNKTGK